MKRTNIVLALLIIACNILAQSVTFQDDVIEWGYYNRPYKRYEAEKDKCKTNATILGASYDKRRVQSEASNQSAVQLIAKDSYIEWVNNVAADGLTIRFSIPDNELGEGTTGVIALYVNNVFVQNITLNSYWAWQYFTIAAGNKIPDNTPSSAKFARMRFDEIHVKLSEKIPQGASFKLVKVDDNTTPYTIDFVELELVPDPVTFESISDPNKIKYDSSQSLSNFIKKHGGKTIYIPEGKYTEENRILIQSNNTKLIGAGMWYTEIYFSASSDDANTYSKRGIETHNNNIVVEGLYLNTVNNKRYYDNNSTYQVGKGFMGSFGSNSVIRNVWVEHFECGAWIADYRRTGSNNLSVQHCRFRNNYADGINLCHGIKNATVEYCSFRNNGDDAMAIWSTGLVCEKNMFQYNTDENTWRGNGLSFYGGQENRARNCVIIDPLDSGISINSEFTGTGFSTTGYSEMQNISVYKGGTGSGTPGIGGTLWGDEKAALNINSNKYYDIVNIKLSNINLYDSKNNGVYIGSDSYEIINLQMNNINIHKALNYGLYYSKPKGNGSFCNISYNDVIIESNALPSTFNFIENCEGNTSVSQVYSSNGIIAIFKAIGASYSIYDSAGRIHRTGKITSEEFEILGLPKGFYCIAVNSGGDFESMKVMVL